MKVACIQQMAQGVGEYEAVFSNLVELTKTAIRAGAELIVQPEAAYPAYFLGLDADMQEKALARSDDYLRTMAELAKENGVHIVAGAAIRVDGKIYNAGVMYDDAGKEIARAYKSNLWHFDDRWFSAGTEYKAFDTKFGRMGIMVCADGRVPEIARILSLDGARVIIDLVNLVASAADPKMLMNQQYAFILPVRAMENGTWLLVSNKAGLEAKTAGYLGRTMIVDPKGNIVADASTDKQEIVYYDVDMEARGEAQVPRRPELYGELVKKNEDLAVTADLKKGVANISDGEVYVTAAQFASADAGEYLEKTTFYCHAASFLGTRLLCLPPMGFAGDVLAMVKAIQPLLADGIVAATAGILDGVEGAVVFDRNAMYGRYHRTHGDGPLSNDPIAVFETPLGKIGAVFGKEPYVPEAPRVAMLLGCEILLWFDDDARPMNTKVMQTRAAENKMFVVRTNSRVKDDVANLVNPDGVILASTFTGTEQASSGMAFLPLARAKCVVPGTSVVSGRLGPTYGALLR